MTNPAAQLFNPLLPSAHWGTSPPRKIAINKNVIVWGSRVAKQHADTDPYKAMNKAIVGISPGPIKTLLKWMANEHNLHVRNLATEKHYLPYTNDFIYDVEMYAAALALQICPEYTREIEQSLRRTVTSPNLELVQIRALEALFANQNTYHLNLQNIYTKGKAGHWKLYGWHAFHELVIVTMAQRISTGPRASAIIEVLNSCPVIKGHVQLALQNGYPLTKGLPTYPGHEVIWPDRDDDLSYTPLELGKIKERVQAWLDDAIQAKMPGGHSELYSGQTSALHAFEEAENDKLVQQADIMREGSWFEGHNLDRPVPNKPDGGLVYRTLHDGKRIETCYADKENAVENT